MSAVLKPDLCIIGAGSGGLSAAAAARAFGASVVLIEKGEMGGDCLNTGCVPSKALIASARHAAAGAEGAGFGVSFDAPKVSFGKIHDHVAGVVRAIAPHDSVARFEAMGVTVIRSHARFTGKREVQAGDTIVRARRFIVATGSRPAIPPIPGIETVPYLTNETIFGLTRKPQHMIIIGGGHIGLELAQAHRRLGCDVTVIEMLRPLRTEDSELVDIALHRIQADGVVIRDNTPIKSVAMQGHSVAVTVARDGEEEVITGSHLLVAAGRQVNTEDLGLESARIKYNRQGIRTNAGLRTSNRRVYAIGDCAGGMHFTHLANYHAGIVIRSALFGLPAKQDTSIVPRCTYVDPEVASVGLTEHSANQTLKGKFKVLRWSFAENDRARTERRTDGLVKLIVADNGRVLGCGIVSLHAGELVSLFAYAIANRMKVGSFVRFIAPYPTLAEAGKRAAMQFYTDKLSSPWISRWLAFIRWLP